MTDAKTKLIKAVSEGRAQVGSSEVISALLTESLKHVVLSSSCPKKERDSILYYAKLSKTPVDVLKETSAEFGSICGKPFWISAAAIK